VVLLPGYAPDLNPVEGLWAHIKRSLANLAARTLSELETLLRRRLRALQYRHGHRGVREAFGYAVSVTPIRDARR
jgi:transposase